MLIVCTRMSFVCTRMYPYVTRMLLVVLVWCFSHDRDELASHPGSSSNTSIRIFFPPTESGLSSGCVKNCMWPFPACKKLFTFSLTHSLARSLTHSLTFLVRWTCLLHYRRFSRVDSSQYKITLKRSITFCSNGRDRI